MLTRGHLEGGRGQNLQDVNELERRIGIEKERGGFSKNSVGGIKIACHLSTICNDNNELSEWRKYTVAKKASLITS